MRGAASNPFHRHEGHRGNKTSEGSEAFIRVIIQNFTNTIDIVLEGSS